MGFLDQDDLWDRRKLERQLAFLDQNPGLAGVGCLPRIRYEGLEAWPELEMWRAFMGLLTRNGSARLRLGDLVSCSPLCMSGVLVERDEIERIGGFSPDLRWTSDWLAWCCLTATRELGLMTDELVTYRVHGSNELLNMLDSPCLENPTTVRNRLVDWLARSSGKHPAEVEDSLRMHIRPSWWEGQEHGAAHARSG